MQWTAPEILRSSIPIAGSKKADMYSYGIIFKEVLNRTTPYHEYESVFSAKGQRVKSTMSKLWQIIQQISFSEWPIQKMACTSVLQSNFRMKEIWNNIWASDLSVGPRNRQTGRVARRCSSSFRKISKGWFLCIVKKTGHPDTQLQVDQYHGQHGPNAGEVFW